MLKRKEDYLETMYLMEKRNQDIRITDLAKALGVKKPTVVSVIDNLKKEGFVTHEKYGNVFLTKQGRKYAIEIYNKHSILYNFLKNILNLPIDISKSDACKMEHYISNDSIDKILKLSEFIAYIKSNDKEFGSFFDRYLHNNDMCLDEIIDGKDCVDMNSINKGESFRVVSIKGNSKENIISKGILPGKIFILVHKDKNSALVENENISIEVTSNYFKEIFVNIRNKEL